MMTTSSFNDSWTVGPQISIFAKLGGTPEAVPVTLPHDALISTERSAANSGKVAYFPSAAFHYSKTFLAPDEWRGKHVLLHFDGVYRDAMVYVNDALAANRANGYVPFDVVLDAYLRYGEENTIRVELRTHDDSRWYAGAGIYRDVRLEIREPVHIRPGHLQVSMPVIEEDLAIVEFSFPIENLSGETRTVNAAVALDASSGARVAEAVEPVTILPRSSSLARIRAYVDSPELWSIDNPYLYDASAVLSDGENEDQIDAQTLRVGIRSLHLDPRKGLRINGDTVKLRGACIHHDNGPLGSAAFGDAERRKIRLLKAAGFNAIRSAHNLASEAMLDACDELGMIVMDESFDVWTVQKSSFDYSVSFSEWWQRDLEAMVRRDRNHASVVFYSIGNEIPETGDRFGAHLSRRMAETIRSLDSDRFVTNGINGFVSVIDDVIKMIASGAFNAGGEGQAFDGVNDAMGGGAADGMNQLSKSSLVTQRTAEAFSVLDVAGLNYGDARYELDAAERPRRIIVGSETYPVKIADNWPVVLKNPHVIGDFTWTGWDYIGEVGLGRPKYAEEDLSLESPYPWLLAWCGDIDITGYRRPASYFREIVFGLRTEPYIAVRNPEIANRTQVTGMWAWTDSQGSWTWDTGAETSTVVEVYSADDEVELIQDGTSLGRRPAGPENGYAAFFDVQYRPGQLEAIAYSGGRESGRSTLMSATGAPRLAATSESESVEIGPGALIYVPIEVTDEAGTLFTTHEPEVTVTVTGPAVLQALGSARPDNAESFTVDTHRAFRGRLLAILRPTGAGTVQVTAAAEGLPAAEVLVTTFTQISTK